MNAQFERTERLIGKEGIDTLQKAAVIIFGIGGVGSYVAEGLARAGIGELILVDNDCIDITNLNRQIPALHSTLGESKACVMGERIKDINPRCDISAFQRFFLPENADEFDFTKYDYVVDAIDTVKGKLAIIEKAYAENVPVISSMGTGNKLDPTGFKVTEIEKTKVCPLSRVMRHELKKRGIKGVKVVFSDEAPIKQTGSVPASISFVPSVAGLIIAGEVVRDILAKSFQSA